MKILVDKALAELEMDAAVAKALGYKVEWSPQPDGSKVPIRLVGTIDDLGTKRLHWTIVPSYSTDIAAAWELAEMCKHGRFGVGWSETWTVPYCVLGDSIHVYADTIKLAICRAFLKANGIEHIEVPE